MFRKIISILMMIAIVFTTLTFSSCGEIESKNPEKPEEVPLAGTTYSDLFSENYQLIAENNELQFYFNEETTDIKLVNKKTKFEWTSEYYDADMDEYYKGQTFILQYTDKAGAEQEKWSDMDCIENGQYEVTYTDNGVEVYYGVGDIGYEVDFPMSMSVERYENYIAQLGEYSNEAYTMNDCYVLYDFTTPEARESYDDENI